MQPTNLVVWELSTPSIVVEAWANNEPIGIDVSLAQIAADLSKLDHVEYSAYTGDAYEVLNVANIEVNSSSIVVRGTILHYSQGQPNYMVEVEYVYKATNYEREEMKKLIAEQINTPAYN